MYTAQELIQDYAAFFLNSWMVWTLQADNGSGDYFYYTPDKYYYQELSVDIIASHLAGDFTIGLVANVSGPVEILRLG